MGFLFILPLHGKKKKIPAALACQYHGEKVPYGADMSRGEWPFVKRLHASGLYCRVFLCYVAVIQKALILFCQRKRRTRNGNTGKGYLDTGSTFDPEEEGPRSAQRGRYPGRGLREGF
jgi:hypothetical protein